MAANTDFRKAAEQGQQNLEKMSSACTDMLKDTYATTIKGAQDYTGKILEFAQVNANSAFDYIRRLPAVRSPTEFVELSNNHLRQQFETISRQAQELAGLAQGMTMAATDSIKSGVEKARPLS